MKKTFLILVILTMVYSVFAKGSSEKKEQGTYIPLAMYETIEETTEMQGLDWQDEVSEAEVDSLEEAVEAEEAEVTEETSEAE